YNLFVAVKAFYNSLLTLHFISSCSVLAKNSSMSCAVGMLWQKACLLWLAADELVGLVVEPGVSIVSESLIKLQGVVSLTYL
ncbi:hypothetical protein BHE74_00019688, partial [Ensete ventricosum]